MNYLGKSNYSKGKGTVNGLLYAVKTAHVVQGEGNLFNAQRTCELTTTNFKIENEG